MTDVTPLIKSNQMVIQSYNGGFKISGTVYDSHVIVLPDRVIPWDGVSLDVLPKDVDVILMGTGKTVKIPPRSTRPTGMNMDYMDTGGAARAYNALMADGRRVAAALLML